MTVGAIRESPRLRQQVVDVADGVDALEWLAGSRCIQRESVTATVNGFGTLNVAAGGLVL